MCSHCTAVLSCELFFIYMPNFCLKFGYLSIEGRLSNLSLCLSTDACCKMSLAGGCTFWRLEFELLKGIMQIARFIRIQDCFRFCDNTDLLFLVEWWCVWGGVGGYPGMKFWWWSGLVNDAGKLWNHIKIFPVISYT